MSKSLPENLPVGFRFNPTDEELINHYLMLKMIGKDSEVDYVIPEVDFCSHDPWELPSESKIKSDDQIWWFFCKRDYKNPRSKRAKRTTKSGFWKITATEQEIKDPVTKACIARKKILVFRTGPTPGQKTDWVMHEYYPYPENQLPHQRDYVICRLENKSNEKANTRGCDDGEPSGVIVPVCDIENPVENRSDEEAGTVGCDEVERSGDIIPVSDFENPVAPAILEVHGHADRNADLLLPLLFSQDCCITTEDLGLNFEDSFDGGQNINYKHHPEAENAQPGPPGCDEGEPSGDVISVSDFKNPVAPAILEVHGHANRNTDLLSPLLFSLDCCITMEDLGLNFEDSFDGGQNINYKHYPEPENAQPGPPGFDEGEASSVVTFAVENPISHASISEVHGCAEGNADLLAQPIFSPDCCLTMEDLGLNFVDSFNDGQNINYEHHPETDVGNPGCDEGGPILLSEPICSPDCYLAMEDLDGFDDGQNVNYEHHSEPENSLPHQNPHPTCCLENKTDEKAGTPGCNIGEPSSNITYDVDNQVAPTAILVVHGHKEVNAKTLLQPLLSPDCYPTHKYTSSNFSNSFSDDHNKWHALHGADETEESPVEFLDGLVFAPCKNYYEETMNNLFDDSVQQKSLKRSYFQDIPASDDTNVGVDGRVKRSRSLALGE